MCHWCAPQWGVGHSLLFHPPPIFDEPKEEVSVDTDLECLVSDHCISQGLHRDRTRQVGESKEGLTKRLLTKHRYRA